jgi:hypothetical protein
VDLVGGHGVTLPDSNPSSRPYAIAGDRYATYLCDKCDRPIGTNGTVALTIVKPVLVWACYCRECRA